LSLLDTHIGEEVKVGQWTDWTFENLNL